MIRPATRDDVPALFALGVLGVHRYTASIHLDLDSTIYGEIAFAPFRLTEIGRWEIATSILVLGTISLVNLALVILFWKELKATSFDPLYARVSGFSPTLVSRALDENILVFWAHWLVSAPPQ